MTATRRHEIKAGWWVAVTLKPGAAPLRSYVGKVQAVGDRGIRLTLVDWPSGTASGFDLFVPWESITAALVATDKHDLEGFRDEAGRWQERSSGDAVADGST